MGRQSGERCMANDTGLVSRLGPRPAQARQAEMRPRQIDAVFNEAVCFNC